MSDTEMEERRSGQPLEGIRVVEMATLAMGPLAGQTLGDYGAEVIKVESVAGDLFRHNAPARSEGMGHTFLNFNRNKKSLAVDLKSAPGRALIGKLVRGADVLLSSVRPNGMRRLGLDPETLRRDNPELIYCAAHGFSEAGPYAGRPAADDTIQAMSGMVDLQRRAGGGAPAFVATVMADKAVGLMIVNAVMAALLRRLRGGGGEVIEVPMFESMVAFVMPEHMAGRSFEPPEGTAGYARVINPNRRPFRTRDGLMCILPYTTSQWTRFFRLIGRPELTEDERFSTPLGRSQRFDELYALIESVTPQRTNAEWAAVLIESDILFGEVNTVEQLFGDPHLVARGMFEAHDHSSEGPIRMLGFPVSSSAEATRLRHLPPRLGEHGVEIASALGLSGEEIDAMVAAGQLVIPREE